MLYQIDVERMMERLRKILEILIRETLFQELPLKEQIR